MIFGLIDSGTTNTRVRLSDGDRVLAAVSDSVGARDTARAGSNTRLRSALERLVQAAAFQAGLAVADIQVLIASGMITSNLGLLEVPHVPAPVGPADLARAIVTQHFPDIAHCDIAFIPGIKTVAADGELVGSDILRGEETEVAGLRRLMGLTGPVTFLHYGSHHKAVRTDATGTVLGSETTLTGELLQAVIQNTVLASSTLPLSEVSLDAAAWRSGLAMALSEGLGRTLFATRLVEQMLGQSKHAATSFLLGAMTAQDLPMVERALARGDKLVLYGGKQFPAILLAYLAERGDGGAISVADPQSAELAAVVGAIAIYQMSTGGNG